MAENELKNEEETKIEEAKTDEKPEEKSIEQIKDDSFNLLTERIIDKSSEITEMLNKYSLDPESDKIDAAAAFKKIIDELCVIIDLVFCSNLRINA